MEQSNVEALIINADRMRDGPGSSTRQRPMMRVVDGNIAE